MPAGNQRLHLAPHRVEGHKGRVLPDDRRLRIQPAGQGVGVLAVHAGGKQAPLGQQGILLPHGEAGERAVDAGQQGNPAEKLGQLQVIMPHGVDGLAGAPPGVAVEYRRVPQEERLLREKRRSLLPGDGRSLRQGQGIVLGVTPGGVCVQERMGLPGHGSPVVGAVPGFAPARRHGVGQAGGEGRGAEAPGVDGILFQHA